jgi:Spy/CpxP family protein refolding chaperone
MKNKTKTSIILLSTLLIGILIGALISGSFRYRRAHQIDKMSHQEKFLKGMENIIKPDEEQKKKIDKVLKQRYAQIAEIREKHMDEMMDILDSLKQDMNKILTEEQRQRLEENLKRGIKRMVKHRLDFLTHKLKLDEEQQEKIYDIMYKWDEKMHPDMNRMERERQPGKPLFREHFEEINKEIEEILTPEQVKEFRKIHNEMRPPFGHGPGGGRDFFKTESIFVPE